VSIFSLATDLVQLYARLRDTDVNGWGYCVTCGNLVHFSASDGGHCIPKGNTCNQASIDTRNVNLQCRLCNSTADSVAGPTAELCAVVLSVAGAAVENRTEGIVGGFGVGEKYRQFIEKKYGPGTYQVLYCKGKQLLDRGDAHNAVALFRKLCKKMAKNKNFVVNIQ
jgi:hypothetical protein